MGEARSIVDKQYEAINAGDVDAAMATQADDVDGLVPGAGPLRGRDAFKEFVQPFLTAFPDAKLHADNVVETSDTVVVEGRFTGLNTGPLMTPAGEMPPTGKSIDLPFSDIFRVTGGTIVSHHTYFDQADFMQQLGLMPTPGG